MKKKENGSMTVEASICLPIFLFAMILIGYLGQMIRCQDEVQSALSRVAKEAAAEYGMSKSNTIKSQAYYLAKMSLYLEGSAGKITFFQSRLLKHHFLFFLWAVTNFASAYIQGLLSVWSGGKRKMKKTVLFI